MQNKLNIPCHKVGSYWVAFLARSGEPYRLIAKTKKEALAKAEREIHEYGKM